jgi:hypothetical protein
MKVGTKSVLYGVHAFWWHPVTVLRAWLDLYGNPDWKMCVCIFVHDLGYWGCESMDGKDGDEHPERGARIANSLLDHNFHNGVGFIEGDDKWDTEAKKIEWKYYYMCRYHSRSYAKRYGKQPSDLCWADKLSILYDPWWFYLLRAWLSGEIWEYYGDAVALGVEKGIRPNASFREWFAWARHRGVVAARSRDPSTAYELVTT